MTKKDRILRLIDHYSGGNKSEFARMLGVSPQAINTWISRNTFDADVIYANCENLSGDWLLTGEGEMLRNIGREKETTGDNDRKSDTSVFLDRIAMQAEEIGRLKARIAELERRGN
ncbi:MAG: helix-turn-helix domain containing protein [Bacteroidales bacterium]|nr:helix-turn-helix domain containing protein [Bacteroidales bacterium]